MREIKFRVWNKKLNRFAPDSCSINLQGDDEGVWFDTFTGNFDVEFWPMEDCELLQFTGLKDKDGVEIYEGDVLRYVWKSKIETITREVLFIDGCFAVKESDNCDHALCGICSDENHKGSHVGFVIGNIYENPSIF